MSHDAFPFLETIRAAMARDDADAGPWLVYADWLEERGECELAELIRTACELETLGPGRPVIPCIAIDVGCDTKNGVVIHAAAWRDMIYRAINSSGRPIALAGETVRLVTRNAMNAEPPYDLDATIQSFEASYGRVRLMATLAEPDPHAARRDAATRRVGELEQAIAKAMPHLGGSPPAMTWRRGLVIELSAEWRAWLAHGDKIASRHPVVAVQLCDLAGWDEIDGPISWDATETVASFARWPGVGFSIQRIIRGRNLQPWPVQPVRSGDTLEWLPMWRGEDRGGEGGPAG